MNIDGLDIYKLSLALGQEIWGIVVTWDYFSKDTVGKQIIRAVDSIAANTSEGYGRYYFKDEKRFLFYARGSLHETKTFLKIANSRQLISNQKYIELNANSELLAKKLNAFINSINKKLENTNQ